MTANKHKFTQAYFAYAASKDCFLDTNQSQIIHEAKDFIGDKFRELKPNYKPIYVHFVNEMSTNNVLMSFNALMDDWADVRYMHLDM